jgi:hypothetical protein
MARTEQKYVVEVRIVSSSGDAVTAEANLNDRYEISGFRKAAIAEALRELADDLDRDG